MRILRPFQETSRVRSLANRHFLQALLTAAGLALLVAMLWRILDAQEDAHVERALGMAADGAALLIERDIQGRVADLSRMARRWRFRDGLPRPEWENDASAYLTDHPGLRAIAWVDETDRVQWILPWEGTEQAHGINLGFEPERKRVLALARESRRPVLSDVIQLLDGHQGLLALVPLEQSSGFTGDLLGVFRIREWLDTVFEDFPVTGISLSIFRGDRMIYHKTAQGKVGTEPPAAASLLDLGDHRWRLVAQPDQAFEADIRSPHPGLVLAGGLILAVVTGAAVGLGGLARHRATGLSMLNSELKQRIGAQQAAERSLRKREAHFKLLAQASPSMIFLSDAEGEITYVNEQFHRITGLPEASWNGDAWVETTHPGDRERIYRHWKSTVSRGEPWREEYRVLRPDGRTIWLLELAVPIRDDAGQISGYIGTGTEITARRQAEDALREERDFNRRLVETAPVIVLVLDDAGHIVHFNRFLSQLTGHRLSEVAGRDFLSAFMPSAERDRASALFRKARGDGGASGAVFPILTTEGEERLIEWHLTDLSNEQEKAMGMLAIGRDITDLRRAEQAAERLRSELAHAMRVTSIGEIATGLAHEVNQPLAAISNYCELARDLIREEPGMPRDLGYALDQAVVQAHRAGSIVQSVRNFLRRGKPELSRTELGAVAREALLVVQPEAREKKVRIDLDLPEGLPPVMGNRLQLVQILVNLMFNGIEAMTEADSRQRLIRVSATVGGEGRIEVSVRDTGPGVDPERRERLFDAFETDKPDGMGMGLAICRTLAEAHGGKIWTRPGESGGAEFLFTLPIANRGESG